MLKLGFGIKLLIYTSIVVAIASFITAFVPYQKSKAHLEKQLANELLYLVSTASTAINIDAHEEIFFDPEEGLSGKDEFHVINQKLIEISDINKLEHHQGLSPIYTLRPVSRKDGVERLEFVAMTDKDKQGNFFTGSVIAKEDFHDLVLNGKSHTTGIYEDSEGLWITAAVPLRWHNGDVVGIIQADRPVDFYNEHLNDLQRKYLFGGFIGMLLGILFAFSFFTFFLRPVKTLLEATQKFAEGKLDYRITKKRSDEFGELFVSYNNMAEHLSKALNDVKQTNKDLEHQAVELESMALFAHLNPGPVMRFKPDGYIELCNPPAEKIITIESSLQDLNAYEIFTELEKGELETIIEKNQQKVITLQLGNSWFQFTLRGAAEFGFANAYGADITDRVTAQNEAMNEREKAEAANKAKSLFLATMSHELRTPMNAIIGFTNLAKKQPINSRVKEQLERVTTASQALLELINNILDFTKIESGNLEVECIDINLRKELDAIFDIFCNMTREKGIDLYIWISPEIPDTVTTDPLRLKQILINLLNNAIKFTSEGTVCLYVTIYNNDGCSRILFECFDTGIGISEEKIKKLFKPFIQADSSTTRNYGGTGLGLSISQKLATLLEGKIAIQSTVGEGSCFYFSIPLQNDSPGDTYASKNTSKTTLKTNSEPSSNTYPDKNLIVIEKNAKSMECIKKILAPFEVTVFPYSSLESALYHLKAAKETPGLISGILYSAQFDDNSISTFSDEYCEMTDLSSIPAIVLHPNPDFMLPDACKFVVKKVLEKPVKQDCLFQVADKLLCSDTAFFEKESTSYDNYDYTEDYCEELSLNGTNILIAEDHPANQALIQDLMEEVGANYKIANNGKEALEKLGIERYHVILMDMQMPVMDGYATLQEIRKNTIWKTIPVIALTANALAGDEEKCRKAGASDFLSKPIAFDQLQSKLLYWVNRQHYQEEFFENSPTTPAENAMTASSLESSEETASTLDLELDKLQQEVVEEYNQAQQESIQASKTVNPHPQVLSKHTLKVLIAEDDPVNQVLAEDLMTEFGVDFKIVDNGKEAVDELKAVQEQNQTNYDIVLMDMQMPVMDGYEATETIRQLDHHSEIPIIALTANAMIGDEEKCRNAGVSDFLSKPIDQDLLLSTINKWIKQDAYRPRSS